MARIEHNVEIGAIFISDRDDVFGFRWFPVLLLVILLVLSIASCNSEWKDNQKLTKDIEGVKMKYTELSCRTRGLTVETVEGIKLCMNPETRALHKIDDVK